MDRVLHQLTNGPMSKAELSRGLGQKTISGQLNKVIRLLIGDGSIGYTIPEKPCSRLQRYRLKDQGRRAIHHRKWTATTAAPLTLARGLHPRTTRTLVGLPFNSFVLGGVVWGAGVGAPRTWGNHCLA